MVAEVDVADVVRDVSEEKKTGTKAREEEIFNIKFSVCEQLVSTHLS